MHILYSCYLTLSAQEGAPPSSLGSAGTLSFLSTLSLSPLSLTALSEQSAIFTPSISPSASSPNPSDTLMSPIPVSQQLPHLATRESCLLIASRCHLQLAAETKRSTLNENAEQAERQAGSHLGLFRTPLPLCPTSGLGRILRPTCWHSCWPI